MAVADREVNSAATANDDFFMFTFLELSKRLKKRMGKAFQPIAETFYRVSYLFEK